MLKSVGFNSLLHFYSWENLEAIPVTHNNPRLVVSIPPIPLEFFNGFGIRAPMD